MGPDGIPLTPEPFNSAMPKTEHAVWCEHYGKLVGKTVASVCFDNSDTSMPTMYGLLFSDGTIAWIVCDPEGNGPGFLDIGDQTKGKTNG